VARIDDRCYGTVNLARALLQQDEVVEGTSRAGDALALAGERGLHGSTGTALHMREGAVMADNDKADKETKDEAAKEKRDKNGSLPGVDKKRWDDFKKKG